MSEESLGQKIRQARKKRKWSQETLAEKLQVATRTVLRREIKNELPNTENQQGLIDLLGFKEEDFRRQSRQTVEVQKQDKLASPIIVSELERMLPAKEDFKMYCGRRIYGRDGKYRRKTTYVTVNGTPLKDFSINKRNQEKMTVFEWGYRGAGPSVLAQSILADYLGEKYPESGYATSRESNALLFANLFKEDFIANLPRPSEDNFMDNYWQISSNQIRKWFYFLESEGITRTTLWDDLWDDLYVE